MDGETPKLLLVSARRRSHVWIFPKGRVERGERAAACALRETYEETGVRGVVVAEIGKLVTLRGGGKKVRARYYLVRRESESPSPEGRRKRWLSPASAFASLSTPHSRKLLVRALRELESASQVAKGTYLITLQQKETRNSLGRELWREVRFLLRSFEESIDRLRSR